MAAADAAFAGRTRRPIGPFPIAVVRATAALILQVTIRVMSQPFTWRSRIRFADTDGSTRIHYSALFRHLEAAETEFLRSVGLDYSRWFAMGLSVPRVHVEADYLASLVFDDEIDIEVRLERLGESSFTLGFWVVKVPGGEEAARGRLVGVCMNRGDGKSTQFPPDIRRALEQLLAR